MDNAPLHKKKEIAAILEKPGHAFLPLPPYAPDFNHIAQTFGGPKKRRDVVPAGTSIEAIIKMTINFSSGYNWRDYEGVKYFS